MPDWIDDELGDGYEQRTIPLGADPDGEGTIEATLVRRLDPAPKDASVIYVHGFSDYFFQRELADFFTERGFAFYALDLRKCGRSRRDGHTGTTCRISACTTPSSSVRWRSSVRRRMASRS